MKIVHISDVHIRNLKMHSEYRKVFDNLYRKIEELKPDVVINTGDTAHTKTQISPEFVEMASDHMRKVAELAEYHIILGNHDLNLMNPDRQDALTPIVDSLGSDKIHLHKASGRFELRPGFNLWVFSLADQENYPLPSHWAQFPDDVNIGLFHGSVSTCVTDSNWRMTHVEHDLSIFDGLDYALLGDIHKQQFFKDGRIAYPGSLIQQNFGEELDKGFLLWDIKDKKEFSVTPHILTGSRKFYTIRLNEDMSIPNDPIEDGSHIRISPPTQITLVQQKAIEKEVKKLYKPYDVITLSATSIGTQKAIVGKKSIDVENLRQLAVQERLIRDWFKGKKLEDKILDKILELNRKYQIHIEQNDDTSRNISWKINKLLWSNLFNYGENNFIDFEKVSGLTGIFAPNASGKSNLIDVIMETCFDATTKGVSKNIFLINDNKDSAMVVADITANDQNYIIERKIERIKYGQRKFDQEKEWGKTSVNFEMVDEFGAREPLVGTLRPETEKNIRQRVGTYDDFMLTSLSAQWNALDIISCKETKRKEILYKFLDLDLFAEKGLLAKDESKQYVSQLKDLEENGIEEAAKKLELNIKMRQDSLNELVEKLNDLTEQKRLLESQADDLKNKKTKVDLPKWGDEEIERIRLCDVKMETNRKALNEIVEKLSKIDIDLDKIIKLEQRFDLQTHIEKAKKYDETDELFEKLNREELEKKIQLDTYKKNIGLLGEVPCGDQYPACKFLVNAFDAKRKIGPLEKEWTELRAALVANMAEKDELKQYKEKLEAYYKFMADKEPLEGKKENLKLQIENARLKISSAQSEKDKLLEEEARYNQAKSDIEENETLDAEISSIVRRVASLDSSIKKCHEESQVLNRLMGSDQGVLEKLSSQLSQLQDLRDTCIAFEHYIEAMGKDGIALTILTQKLPLINEEINKILANAADFGVYIEHDPEEQSIRIYIQYGQYKSRLIELGSGAEKMLSSVAIRTALLNISNLPKTNMFIIDEGFGKLDPKNLESIQRMFDYLKTVFDHVIVISHLDSMKDMVDNIIEITSDEEGYAHVEIGG